MNELPVMMVVAPGICLLDIVALGESSLEVAGGTASLSPP